MGSGKRFLAARLAALGLAAAGALAALFYGHVAWHSWRDLHPPRLTVDASVGRGLGATDVSFTSADGIVLRGWYRPAGPAGAIVLLVHGWGAQRGQMAPQARALVDAGYGVLLFDLRAHGASGGTRSSAGYLEQRDVEAALAWLRGRPESAGRPIVAIGFSIGGIAVAEVAARDPAIAAVVLESTSPTLAADYAAETPRNRPFEAALYAWVHRVATSVPIEHVRPVDDLCQIAPRPTLVIYGTADTYVGPADRQQMLGARCPPSASWLAVGSDHERYVHEPDQGLAAALLPFLRRALGAP